jgi:hypothetical protein
LQARIGVILETARDLGSHCCIATGGMAPRRQRDHLEGGAAVLEERALRRTFHLPWRCDVSNVALFDPTTRARTALARLGSSGRRLLLGIAEGVAAARRYESLAALSEAELARRGLAREDLARVAMFGDRGGG